MISRQNNKLARGEQETVAGVYTYRINDKYCIEYDSEDPSAVMLYQSELQKQNKEKERKNLDNLWVKLYGNQVHLYILYQL